MTPSINRTTGYISPQALAGLVLTLALALVPTVTRAAASLQLGFAEPSSANESNRTTFLTWTAEAGGVYKVQSSTNLADPAAWTTEDAVSQSTVGPLKWMAPESISNSKFYRLILPQPEIFSVEPAVVAPGVTEALYVIGQGFGSSSVLTINGVVQGDAVVQSSTSIVSPSFTPDVAGTYRVALVVGGVVVSSFNVTCADALENPELVLQGPPEDPPASPENANLIAIWLSRRGYDYYKAKSDLNAAGLHSNPVFQVNTMAGNMPTAFLSKKGYDYYQSKSAVTFEVAEGKKGLNAVNVKLARMAGGGGGGEMLDLFNAWPSAYHPPALASREVGKRALWGLGGNLNFADQTAVMPFSGELQACDVDMVIPGRGLAFVWARTYHSRLGRFDPSANGWTFSYDVHCARNSLGDIDVFDGTGRKDTFTVQASGTYTCPELFREVTYTATVVRVTFADTGYWEFNPLDGTATAGKLARIVDRNGNIMSLSFDTNGRLAQVVDDLGRTNTVAYTSDGHVASVTDFTGRSVTYQYYQGVKGDLGGAGDLKSVTSPAVTGTPNGNDFPDGKTTIYTYSMGSKLDRENHLLLSVTDPKGQTAAMFSYELNGADPTNYLHCTAAQEGTSAAFRYGWSLVQRPLGSSAITKCIVNDPVGNVTEDYFDARGRCVIEREFTGRATPGLPVTDTVNRPTGKVRDTDPDYYETRWSWNNDSLCTAEISPGGQQVECVYQSDFDPTTPARKRADCRVVREIASSALDLDGDGMADVTDRTWRYEYDPRFGSDPTASLGKKLYVGNLPFRVSDPAAEESVISNTRQRVLDIENVLKNLGLLSRASAGKRFGIGDSSPACPLGRFGRPAINTALNNSLDDLIPDGNGVAIKTKGTGAEANRVTFGRDKLKGTTKTQGDFNLANRFSFEIDGVISATDPRGNVTTASYDQGGNLTQVLKYSRRNGALIAANFDYKERGRLAAITNAPDGNGHRRVDTFSYYTNGPQTGYLQSCVVDADGLAITSTFEYDARGNLTRYVDPRTNDWLFTYNSLDQLVQSSSATLSLCFCKIEWKYAYDANDNRVQSSTVLLDPAGNPQGTCTDNYRYDPLNRLTEIALAVDATHAQTNRFVYDGYDQCVQVLGPDAVSGADPHQTVAYAYDERGLLFQSTTAPGSSLTGTNEFGYDSDRRTVTLKLKADDGAGVASRVITFAYDGFGRLASSIDPMGNQTVCFYDANDNLKTVRHFGELNDVPGSKGNVRLAESRYEFDGLDRCVRTHDLFFDPTTQSPISTGDAMSACVYAPNGECVSVTDSLGRTTSFGYDTACRLSSVTDALGNLVVSVRDRFGNVTSLTRTELPDVGGSPQVFSTTYAYDNLNRCVSSSDNVGNTSTCAYDSLDRVVRETNPNGNDTTYAYDLLGNCLASTNYAGSSSAAAVVRNSQATYDTSSRCLTSTDAKGNTTSYNYDSRGNCTLVTQPDGTRQQLVWSPRSNLIGETDANGTTISNTYDRYDRLVHRDIAARNVLATTTFETFAYDGCSRLVLASNDVSRLDFHYDSFGDCTSSSQDGLAQSATYDSEGNQLSLTYPGGRVVTYAYDVLDQVTNIATMSGGVSHPQLARFACAGPGRLARIGRDNGLITRIDWNGLVNPANSTGDYGWQEVSRVRDGSVASPSLVSDVTGSYSRTQSKLTRADAGRHLTLTYDPLEQLVESSLQLNGVTALDTMYALDAAGNRQHVITNGSFMLPDYAMNSALPPGDFQMNRYTTTPFGAQSYDANGNLLSRINAAGPTFYQYDYADRLVEVDGLSTLGTLSPIATFTYDALGNRISKTTYPGVPAAPMTTQYINAIVEYRDGEDGVSHTRPRNRIIEARVGGVVGQAFVHASGLKEEIRENDKVVFTATGEARYYHCDDLGNTLALTDSGGNVLERYAYGDYGQPQFLSADGTPIVDSTGQPVTASPAGNPFLFHGMEWDGETGLYCDSGLAGQNPFYQDPKTGRGLGFERGDRPTQAQFGTLIDSTVNKITDRYLIGLRVSGTGGNNPWSGSPPDAMQKGTVKFFNEAKGFGRMAGGPPPPVAYKHYITIPHN